MHETAQPPPQSAPPHRLLEYARLIRLHRPIGTYLLVWPMLWSLWWAAQGLPNLKILVVLLLGAVLMRSAGCAINDFADRNLDGQVARTRDRPLAAGTIKPWEAVLVFLVLSSLAFALVLTLNTLTVWLSLGGVLLALVYPFSKRYTHLPQLVLGAAFGWAVPMAWAAQTGELGRLPWLVYIAAVLWAVIYDTLYAMADREDDVRMGAKSTAILFGDADRLAVGILQILLLLTLFLIGINTGMSGYYYVALLVGAALFDHHQWMIRERESQACFDAFLHNSWFGMIVFFGIVLHYLLGA
ncbi:MAG: 4-hydroxybenzoate octaprenyltransferase [Gammaproteobacteria bacterium]|nr:4-hydroxybenzoate octaprenyltransferase [Gammaproteobacteria bacterium]